MDMRLSHNRFSAASQSMLLQMNKIQDSKLDVSMEVLSVKNPRFYNKAVQR